MRTSSTERPSATEAAWPRWLPAALVGACVYVGFQPFTDTGGGEEGNVVNQIGFGLLGIAAGRMVALLPLEQRRALLRPAWLLVLAALLFSVWQADWWPSAFRAGAFSLIVVLCAGATMAWPRSRDEMTGTLLAIAGTTLVFCAIAVFLYPAIGVHGSGGHEWQHVGLWRGTYPHKNVASYVFAAFVVMGLFVMRQGRVGPGLLLAATALVFTLNAGSKTVLGVLPAALAVGWIAARLRSPVLRAGLVVLPLVLLCVATLGAAFVEPVDDALQAVAPNTTYTGRMDLWRFTAEQIGKDVHTGYGFESFWTTPRVTGLEQPIELSWDVRKIVHGHNSYLDAVVTFGLWGALAVFAVVVVRPIYHFARLPRPADGAAGAFAQMCITLWLLCALGGCLESFFLRRSDPVWFTMALALFGLQIAYERTRYLRAAGVKSSGVSRSTTVSAPA